MTTAVDICNAALAMIGEAPKVTALSPATGGVHATLCATLYPMARQKCLAAYPWTFASSRATLEMPAIQVASYSTGADTITTSTDHGFRTNDPFEFDVDAGVTIAAPFEEGVEYYAIRISSTSISVADEVDGDAINITTSTGAAGTVLRRKSDRSSWAYAYAAPSDLLLAHGVIPTECSDEDFPLYLATGTTWPFVQKATASGKPDPIPFRVALNYAGESVVYTNQEDADLIYTAAVTDVDQWTPHFVDMVTADLAARLAGAITKDAKLRRDMQQEFYIKLAEARANDGGQRQLSLPDFQPWNRRA